MVKASTLATLTKLAKAATKGGTDLTALIEAASVAVAAANALLKEAKPILDNVDTEAVAEMAKATMQTAAQGAGKAGKAAKGAAKGAADSAADTVSGIFTKLGEAKDGIFEDLAKTKGEKELKNANNQEYIREQAKKQLRLLNPGEILFTFEEEEAEDKADEAKEKKEEKKSDKAKKDKADKDKDDDDDEEGPNVVLIVVIAVVVLAGVGAAVYFLVIKKKKA